MYAKIQDPEIVNKALEALRNASGPLTIGEISKATGIGWQQARSLLLLLVTQGKVDVSQPTGFRFKLKPEERDEVCQA